MKYSVREVEKEEFWNSFVKKYDLVNILGSWQWIEFERSLGFDVFSYGIFYENELKGVFAYRKVSSKRGGYVLLRQNTFLDWQDSEMVNCFITFLKEIMKKEKVCFFRISPPLLSSESLNEYFHDYGFKKSLVHSIDAQFTNILDLKQDLSNISENMRKNTRYLIRKGQKMGVEVLDTAGDEYIDVFEKIYLETVQRHKWDAPDFEYIRNQFKLFSSKGLARMFVAKYNEDILAVAIFTHFNNQVIYHHSASVSEMNNVPAMYVLMFKAIEFYKGLGINEFNFFGVSSKEKKDHRWDGLSLFKRGFGGFDRELLPSYDYPANTFYYLTRFIDKVR